MIHALIDLLFFSAKFFIVILLLLLFLAGVLSLIMRSREKPQGTIHIKHLNQKFDDMRHQLQSFILSQDEYKKQCKTDKKAAKQREKNHIIDQRKKIYILDFQGDIKGSAVNALREEITAILSAATPRDEVMIKIESGGGMVHAYGLATSQLLRIREKNIPLTVIIDKIAASGGYLMSSVANQIIAAPFALIGSIGVILQLPNFHRLLKEKHVDFEQITAGNYKRTLTVFGENTKEGRDKMKQELEIIHQQFKQVVQDYRPHIDIEKVSTGEHWSGAEAQKLNLVDKLQTSDEWIYSRANDAELFEIHYQIRKSLGEKLFSSVKSAKAAFIKTWDARIPWI